MCNYPKKAWQIGLTENGRADLKITSYHTTQFRNPKTGEWIKEYIEIPCGQCMACRLARSRDWATRCVMESMYHDSSYFLTLTYDDEHIHRSEYLDFETGEILNNFTLCKDDMSRFMKALRQLLPEQKLRFFGCGEYGGQTYRPHLHIIVFGLELNDLKFLKVSPLGDKYYTSDTISKAWRNRGHIIVGEVTYQSCAYVSRYITKKHLGKDSDFYEKFNLVPEFTNSSRRPGIGYDYIVDHFDMFDKTQISLPTETGSKNVVPPKYAKRLLQKFDESAYNAYSERTIERMKLHSDVKFHSSDFWSEDMLQPEVLAYMDMLDTDEFILNQRLQHLPRNTI